MHICVLTTQLDSFKGGNHLPLFGALKDVRFTMVTARAKQDGPLPKNIEVENLNLSLGSYYYGRADRAFAEEVLKKYPLQSAFWKQFDVIHLNQTLSPKLLELTKTKTSLLYAVHHPVTADREVAVAESGIIGKILWRLRYRRLIRWQKELCQRASHIMTVSETVQKRLMSDYGIRKNISIVPNGVNGDEFAPSHEHLTADVIAVGSFLHPRKGFPYLLKLYKALAGKNLRIADVGRRSREQTILLKDIPGVTIHGTVPHEELVTLMKHSSVLVSTSLYEGFGLSLIEALACGHPAFAFDAGAVSEVLSPIDPELVVPLRDVAELTKRVRGYLSLPQKDKQRKAEHYRAKVLELYSMEKAAEALKRVYASLKK